MIGAPSLQHELFERVVTLPRSEGGAWAGGDDGGGGATPSPAAATSAAVSFPRSSQSQAIARTAVGCVSAVLRGHAEALYAADVAEDDARAELLKFSGAIGEWVSQYVVAPGSSPAPARGGGPPGAFGAFGGAAVGGGAPRGAAGGPAEGQRGASLTVAIEGVIATEERVWSPLLGLKGHVDATIVAAVAPAAAAPRGGGGPHHRAPDGGIGGGCGGSVATMLPLELKTGRKSQYTQMAHRAQLMLYTLLLRARHGAHRPPRSRSQSGGAPSGGGGGCGFGGLLLYLSPNEQNVSTEHLEPVTNELRSLFSVRNRHAVHLERMRADAVAFEKRAGVVAAAVDAADATAGAAAAARGVVAGGADGGVGGVAEAAATTTDDRRNAAAAEAAAADGRELARALEAWDGAALPRMEDNESECARCFNAAECMLHHAAAERGDRASSGAPPTFDAAVGHLDRAQLACVRRRRTNTPREREREKQRREREGKREREGAEGGAGGGAEIPFQIANATTNILQCGRAIVISLSSLSLSFSLSSSLSPSLLSCVSAAAAAAAALR